MKLIRFGLLAAVTIIATTLVTAADLPEAFIAKYNEAVREFRAENYDKALSVLDQAEKISPSQPDATNLKGAIYLRKRDFPKARETFEKTLASDPSSYYPKFNLAEILFLQKKYPEAREKFEILLPQIPPNLIRQEAPLVRYKILLTHLQQDNYTTAQEIADRFSPDGETPAYYYAKAAIAAKRGQTADMESPLKLAKEKYPPATNQRFTVSLQELKFVPNPLAMATVPPVSRTASVAPTTPVPPAPVVAKAPTPPAPTAEWARLSPEKMNLGKPVVPAVSADKIPPATPVIESTAKIETLPVAVVPPVVETRPPAVEKAEAKAETKVAMVEPTPELSAKFMAKFDEAMKQFVARDFATTLKTLEEADTILPRQAGVANLRGVIFVKQKDLGAAEAEFDKALDYDPTLWKARLNKGELSFARKNYAEARQRYQTLLEQTTASNQDFERDYLRYRILLTQLMDGQVSAVKETIRGFDYTASTPWQHFSSAALEYSQGHTKEAESWIISADRIYDPMKNQVFAQSISEIGWSQEKADVPPIVAKAQVPPSDVITTEPQAMPAPAPVVMAQAETPTPVDGAVSIPNVSVKAPEPTQADAVVSLPQIQAEPEWKDDPDLINQIRSWLFWLVILLAAFFGVRFIYGWYRRSELFKASIPSIDPMDMGLRQTRPAMAGLSPSTLAPTQREPEVQRPKSAFPPPVASLAGSAMSVTPSATAKTPPATAKIPNLTVPPQFMTPPPKTEPAPAPATTEASRALPSQIPPAPAPTPEVTRKSYAAPNKKFELRTADTSEVSVQTAASMKGPQPAVVPLPTIAAVSPATPSISVPPVPAFSEPEPTVAARPPQPVWTSALVSELASPQIETPAAEPVAPPAPVPPLPVEPPVTVSAAPAPASFFESQVVALPVSPAAVPTPTVAPASTLFASAAAPQPVPMPPVQTHLGFQPAGPVPVPVQAPAPTPVVEKPSVLTPQILVPTVRHGFGIARVYLTPDFQIAALRMIRVAGEVSGITPSFELISRLPDAPSIPRGYVELAALRAFEPSVLGLAADASAVVHLAPSSEHMSIAAEFMTMQPLEHTPLPAFEMHDMSRRATETGSTLGLYFQIAAVDLNNQFEVNSVVLYRLYNASMMMAMSRPFDITSIQLGSDFRLSAVRLGRSTPGRRSVVTGAGSQSTPPAPGSIEFLISALQITSRFEVESLLLNPHQTA